MMACGVHRPVAQARAAAPTVGTTLDSAVPASVLDAPLRDGWGRPTTLRAWPGKVIVLTDIMTLCQESCPIVTASMVTAARRLAGTPLASRVEFVSVTIDPVRDDGRHLRAYQRQFGNVPHWTVLDRVAAGGGLPGGARSGSGATPSGSSGRTRGTGSPACR